MRVVSTTTLCILCICLSSAIHCHAQNPQVPAIAAPAIPVAPVTLRDICRVKGQEQNTLQGIGLVVGLKGTGDGSSMVTYRHLARLTQLLGGGIATDAQGFPDISEVEDSPNVATVMVSAKVPTSGAQQGDLLDCHVSAISASSLAGGRLVAAYMMGPRADRPVVYAIAEGRIDIPDDSVPTSGMIRDGCKMEATIKNSFVSQSGVVTLILDSDLASFSNAALVQDALNGLNQGGFSDGANATESYIDIKAIDQHHIEVKVPPVYEDKLVAFVSLLLEQPLTNIKNKKRVTIDERSGVIAIGDDVMISPGAISHKNLSIEAKAPTNGFVGLDVANPKQLRPRLKNLVEALNGLNVPTADVIDIIRTLHANGQLYGELKFL
ncbi:MAG: flagellar basal body P-ring protein FlgI [Aureliella sp.]